MITTAEPAGIPQPRADQSKSNAYKRAMARFGAGSLMISLLIHILFILLAIFFLYRWIEPRQETSPDLPMGGGGGGSGGETAHKIKNTMRRAITTSVVQKRITSTATNAAFTLPDTTDLNDSVMPMNAITSSGAGDGTGGGRGLGDGMGVGLGNHAGKGMGTGQHGIVAFIPNLIKGRCTDQERNNMLKEAGGSPAVEQSVKKSLAWLKSQQNSDGSWGSAHQVGMTGLTLLCYLGHCEGTQSIEYGENVNKGISFLINNSMKNNGMMASTLAPISWVYEHAIATYALSESLTFSRSLTFETPGLEEAVKKAAMVIIKGQNHNGSWDYHYQASGRNDLSVMGWQMQALKAAQASGIQLDELDACIRKATRCLTTQIAKGGVHIEGGAFAYSGGAAKDRPAMTPVAALCLQQWSKENSAECKAGVKYILAGLADRTVPAGKRKTAGSPQELYQFHYQDNCDVYALYYASQVMRNEGGKGWELMNQTIMAELVPNQNSDGSFKLEANKTKPHVHDTSTAGASRQIYLQCLNTLILEVYYRFLPATSSGKKGGGIRGLDDLHGL